MYQHLKKLGKITQVLTAMPEKINQKIISQCCLKDNYTGVFCVWAQAITNDLSKTREQFQSTLAVFKDTFGSFCFMQVVQIYPRTPVHHSLMEISV